MSETAVSETAVSETAVSEAAAGERPGSMKAAVLAELGMPLTIDRRPRPRPDGDQVLVRVRAAGLCHTDLHLIAGVPAGPPMPMVLGHEIAGEVADPGEGAESATGRRLRTGDRVVVYYYDGCSRCRWCRDGLENLCGQVNAKWGFDTDGGFAQYLAVPARCLLHVPEPVGLGLAAVLGCSGTTGVHVVDTVARVTGGETVVVIGAGGVGLAAAQVAVARGARVVAVDPHDGSRRTAVDLGARGAVDPDAGDVAESVRRITAEDGVDVVIDTVGSAETPQQALDLIRPQGRVVLVGYTHRPAPLRVVTAVTREARILGSVGATRADAMEALRLAESGALTIPIAGRYPLERVNEAIERLRSGQVTGRLVLLP